MTPVPVAEQWKNEMTQVQVPWMKELDTLRHFIRMNKRPPQRSIANYEHLLAAVSEHVTARCTVLKQLLSVPQNAPKIFTSTVTIDTLLKVTNLCANYLRCGPKLCNLYSLIISCNSLMSSDLITA